MAKSSSAADIVVRCFESEEEIYDFLDGDLANPLTKQSYKGLVGYYNLPTKLHCCVAKENGNLCLHEHGKGWVVEKIDGTYTLMGKDCANDKYGADSKLIKDIVHYKNAIRRQARLEKVIKHLEKRLEREKALTELRTQLDALYSRVQQFVSELGPQTGRRLQDMYRSGSTQVIVNAVKYREYEEDGRSKKERSAFQHRLGVLNGLAVVARESYTPIHIAITNILHAFEAAASLGAQPQKGEVDALASRLDDFDRIIGQGQALLGAEAQFLGNNMELLCFVDDERADRYKCARLAMHQKGIAGNKDVAKTWLSKLETDLKQQLGVNNIEIR